MKVLVVVWLTAVAQGCGEARSPDDLGLGHSSAERSRLESGRAVYATYCVGCHGEKGDGNGRAASFLSPKPRDFRVGRVKFAAVASGDAPSREDYTRIITKGLAGTAMPAFPFLSTAERDSVIAYVRSFYERAGEAAGAPVDLGQNPWIGREAEGRAVGRVLYHTKAQCWSCHPAYETRVEIARMVHEATGREAGEMRADLYVGQLRDSEWGAPIRAPDFLQNRVKGGTEVEDLARTISAGVGGTAMPTWAGALTARELWGLAYYVQSVARMRGLPAAERLHERLAAQGR
jgi:cytochrome c oxidase cbb3-type subunit 2